MGNGKTAAIALPDSSLLPIRTIASLTGVNPVTLRAWERRYNLLKPVRTPKGHRLYSMADVDHIKQVVKLLDGGMAISQVKVVLDDTNSVEAGGQAIAGRFDVWRYYHKRLLNSVISFDEHSVNELYNEVLSLYPVEIVTDRLIVPLLKELGWRWTRGGDGTIAEEHFFTVYLRNKLGARFHHRDSATQGPRLLVACLPGERHEVGILLFALVAQDWNYTVVMLGADVPLSELAGVVQRARCEAVVLAGSTDFSNQILTDELPATIATLNVPVFVGGRIVEQQSDALSATGAILLEADLKRSMHIINTTLLDE